MLVCSVVIQARKGTILADVAEAAAALDAPDFTTLFGTLIDSPGDAKDILDGFVGQRITEAASATTTVSAAMAYKIAMLEDTTAVSAVGVVLPGVAGTITEPAAADATQDATSVSGGVQRAGMVGTVMVNSDGTARQSQADTTMVNL